MRGVKLAPEDGNKMTTRNPNDDVMGERPIPYWAFASRADQVEWLTPEPCYDGSDEFEQMKLDEMAEDAKLDQLAALEERMVEEYV